MADTYAIVESGGKQYRAEKGSTLVVDRLPDDEGAKVNLRAVMFRGDKDVVLDGGELEKVKVEAVVAGHERGPKLRVLKYKAKKGYRRRAGHRSELTRLEVTDVKMLTRKPAAKAEAKPKAETASKAKASTASKPAAKPKTTAAKKPASTTKAGTAKKPAAKASTSSAKKPAAKKTTTRKRSTTRKTSTQKKES